jgi:ABC-type transporter Mla subunit MlaD
MESKEQLRSASDEVLVAVEKLRALEVEKRSVSPTNPRFQKLARQVEQLADQLGSTAEAQANLGEKLAAQHANGAAAAPPVEETVRDVTTILAEWRDAERRAGRAVARSRAAAAAHADVDRLRAEYQRAHRMAKKRNGFS